MKRTPLNRANQHLATVAVALVLTFESGRALAQRPLGVDVYAGDGTVTWSTVKSSGRSFAWAKATEGTYYIDSHYTSNISNGKAAGLVMGAYHFARPDLDSPATEVSYFWNEAGGTIADDGKTFMPMLDFETFSGFKGASSYADWANQWCNGVVSDAAGNGVHIKPIIYVSSCNACDLNSSVSGWLADLANYNGESAQTGNPWNVCTSCEVWGSGVWNVWQYSDAVSVPGVPGNGSGFADVDVFNGSAASLTATMVASGNLAIHPVVLVGTNGAMSAYAIFTDGSIHTTWQSTAGGPWSSWASLGGSGNTALSGVVLSDGRMALYACGGGAVWTSWQTNSGGTWQPWTSLGGNGFTQVKALAFSDDHLAVVGCGNGTAVNYDVQNSPGGAWSGWSVIGGGTGFSAIDALVLTNQTVSVFSCGGSDVKTSWQSTPGGSFATWSSVGGNGFTQVKALAFSDNHMALIGCGNGTAVNYQAQSQAGGTWPGWTSLGGSGFSSIDGIIDSSENVSVFGCGGNSVSTTWQSTPGGSFSGWTSLGGSGFETVTGIILPTGVMSAFGGASGTPLWTIWQTSEGGTWSNWTSLGGTLK